MVDTTTVTSTMLVKDGKEKTEKMEEVKVTIVVEKEIAAILTVDCDKAITAAFGLQELYDNPSQYRRDALQAASDMFLRAQCARAIAQWDNLVTRFSKTQKYKNIGRVEVESKLKDNPKTRPIWNVAEKATAIKARL